MSRVISEASSATWELGKVSRFRKDSRVGTAFHKSTSRRMTTNWYFNWDLCMVPDEFVEAVEAAGAPFGIIPAGEQAVDIARVEAGLMIPGCDYGQFGNPNLLSGSHCKMARNQDRLVSPYDLNGGAFVSLDKDFIGKAGLQAEQANGGARYDLLGLEIDWRAIVTHCGDQGIAPLIGTKVDWEGRGLCLNGKDCGWASSERALFK
jgi:glycine cleavage system aminomethyltransferase T